MNRLTGRRGPARVTGMGRVGELDGVRGVAILLVVVGHAAGGSGGGVGVALFFVLSGYLITGLLDRERTATGRVDLRAFWTRRARRLGPALAGPLLIGALLTVLAVGSLRTVAYVPVADFAASAGASLGPLDHLWSLSVEEQFYLAWPLLLPLLRPRVIGALAVLLTGWRFTLDGAGWDAWAYYGLLPNAALLAAGAWLALRDVRARPWVTIPAGVVLVGLCWVSPGAVPPAWVQVAAGACGVVMVAGARGATWLGVGWLRWFGTISYGWYLWHFVLMWAVLRTPWAWPVAVVSLGVAAASWYWLERPVLERGRAPRPDREAETGGVPAVQGERAV